MRSFILSLAALSLAAGIVSAEESNTQQKTANTQMTDQQTPAARAMLQQKLRKSLTDASFENIQIVDAAYLVHARTDDGNRVVMYINPPSIAAPTGTTDDTQARRVQVSGSNEVKVDGRNAASGSRIRRANFEILFGCFPAKTRGALQDEGHGLAYDLERAAPEAIPAKA